MGIGVAVVSSLVAERCLFLFDIRLSSLMLFGPGR